MLKIIIFFRSIVKNKLIILYILLILLCNITFANPLNDFRRKDNLGEFEKEILYLAGHLNQLENEFFSFSDENIINSFGYSGDKPENQVSPFDYYNIRPLKSGFAFSNRFLFTIKTRLNYDLRCNIKLDSYNASGDNDINHSWGAPLPFLCKDNNFTFAHVELLAMEPDISAVFGSFYPATLSDLVYSPPKNPSLYGPEKLPARGFKLGASINPLNMEIIYALDSSRDDNYNFSSFIYGGRGGFSHRFFKGGVSLLHGEQNKDFQNVYSFDINADFSGTFHFKGEICRSYYHFDNISDASGAFYLNLEKNFKNIIVGGEYIWVSPSYDPMRLHCDYSKRELLGAGKFANNRKGIDVYAIFPFRNCEAKVEFIYFSQILTGDNDKPFIDNYFSPVFDGDRGDVKAFELYFKGFSDKKVNIAGNMEILKLFRNSVMSPVDFTQTSFCLEADFIPADFFKFTSGIIYINRKGNYYNSENISQITPLLKCEFNISPSINISLEHRHMFSRNYVDYSNDFNFSQTVMRTKIKF